MNNTHDDVRTSSDPQATIDLLSRRVAQLKKDLAERDAALQGREENARTIPDYGGASNSQAHGWLREKENKDDCGEVGDRNEDEERGSEILDPQKEKKWKETITRLERRCDLLADAVQQRHKGEVSLVDSLFQKTTSQFADEVVVYCL
jgi:hypothetical protein